jgi:hypothetical protein
MSDHLYSPSLFRLLKTTGVGPDEMLVALDCAYRPRSAH